MNKIPDNYDIFIMQQIIFFLKI